MDGNIWPPASDLVAGSGGGGKSSGSGGSTPTEQSNTLFSKTYGVIMDVLSEGPIGGLVNGGESIRFNNTAILNPDGTSPFAGVWAALQYGYPTQSPIVGWPTPANIDPGSTQTISVEVTASGGAVVETISDANATSAIVTIMTPQLFKTDSSNGDINGDLVNFKIETRVGTGASWQQVILDSFAGKTTTPYSRDYRVIRPSGTGDWQIQVTRITPDSTTLTEVNAIYWTTLQTIYDNLMEYPNTAYAMLQFDSSLFGSSIPARTYDINGRLLQVPSNYDPIARTYSGVWDGTFQTAFSNNPAWVFYDLVTNNWFGAGEVIDASTVDKWALYAIAQYCDTMVSNGNGGQEPLYTFNGVLNAADDGIKTLQQIAAMFDSIVYANSDTVTVIQDQNATPVQLVTQANVVNGEFSYQGTSLSARPTAVRCMFIDPNANWSPSVEVVEFPQMIQKYGYWTQDIQLIGVTSRSQAARKGLKTLLLAWYCDEVVTFVGGYDMANLNPGDMILIADPNYQGMRCGGRCASNSTVSVVELDEPVTLEGGQTYTLYVTYKSGVIDSRPVGNSSGHYTSLTVASAFSQAPDAESVWILSGSGLQPRQFRVLTATEKAVNEIEVQAVFYDPGLETQVLTGIAAAPPTFSDLPNLVVPLPPPTQLTIQENLTGVGKTTVIRCTVSWTPPNDPRVASYQVQAINAAGAATTYVTVSNTIDIDGLGIDTYVFQVRAVSTTGLVSAWLKSTATTVNGTSPLPATPTGLTAQGGIRLVQLAWNSNQERDLDHYVIERAPDVGGAPGTFSVLANSSGTSYTDAQSNVILPNTSWWYQISAVTTTSIASAYCTPVKATTSLLVTADLEDGILTTAKFAQSINPPVIVADTTHSTDISGNPLIAGQLAVSESDGQLYKYTAGSPLFTPLPVQLSNGQVVASTIAAGAVGATQIAAGSIHTTMLASTFQLTSSSQIGTAVIGTAQIQDLSVGTSNIASGAVTGVYYSYSNYGGAHNPSGAISSISVSIPAGDEKVLVWCYFDSGVPELGNGTWAEVPENNDYTMTLERDGTIIYQAAYLFPRGLYLQDYPGAGSHTYTSYISSSYSSDTLFDAEMVVMVCNK